MYGRHTPLRFFPYRSVYLEYELTVVFTGFVGCGDGGEPHVDEHGFTRAWRTGEEEALSIEWVSARTIIHYYERREKVYGEVE